MNFSPISPDYQLASLTKFKLSIFVNTYRKWTILPKRLIVIKSCRIAIHVFQACSRRPDTCWIDVHVLNRCNNIYKLLNCVMIKNITDPAFLVRPRRRILKLCSEYELFERNLKSSVWVIGNNEGQHLSKRSNWLQFASKRCRRKQRGLSDDL